MYSGYVPSLGKIRLSHKTTAYSNEGRLAIFASQRNVAIRYSTKAESGWTHVLIQCLPHTVIRFDESLVHAQAAKKYDGTFP